MHTIFEQAKQNGFLILDGAFGTMLQKEGLPMGHRPEKLNLTHPAQITALHRRYFEAGSRLVYANTFGANPYTFRNTGLDCGEVIRAGIACAKEAARPFNGLVGLDVSSLGVLMQPMGEMDFQTAYDAFAFTMKEGQSAGADMIALETFTSLEEIRAALLAAKENTTLPVFATMSFEENGLTFTGTSPEAMALTLTALGADAIGVNCSVGPEKLYSIIERIRRCTDLPLIAKPNAGLPRPDGSGYELSAEAFAAQMERFTELGVTIVGGCCGTSPEHIRLLAQRFASLTPLPANSRETPLSTLCSKKKLVVPDSIRVIGERINPTGKKRFKQALVEHDMAYICAQAAKQAEAGADILDVNVGADGVDEKALMRDVVTAIQGVTDLPLQIDSTNAAVIEAGLRAANGICIVNSVNADPETLRAILPIVKKYGAYVLGLTLDQHGLPKDADERVALAKRILQAALEHGIPKERVLIDCLTLTASAQPEQAMETLVAVERVTNELGLRTILGVSNISFGLPQRGVVNRTFLAMALAKGLTMPILNPLDEAMMQTVYAARLLLGQDENAKGYISAVQTDALAQPAAAPADPRERLCHAVYTGLEADAATNTEALLRAGQLDPFELVNQLLIPTLDKVGAAYEKGTLFLPELISAANAAKAAFAKINEMFPPVEGESRGKILLATVKGDIHDIGKNIVKVVLENYGFDVTDLGRDVDPALIVETAVRNNIPLIGLSALMTTTLPSMAQTIQALRQSGHPCRIMTGGAVLTEEYALQIGADFYARDAKASADYAKQVFAKEGV